MRIVSPSLLSADFSALAQDIERIPDAQWLHVDVMDGHFVPNITVGVPVVESLRKRTDRFLDVHLMITDPLQYAGKFAAAGADLVCFHLEADADPKAVISAVRDAGKKVGIALKPGTPAEAARPYAELVDMILVMTVEPGFGGQSFLRDMLEKIRAVDAIRRETGSRLLIQVDGGINETTARECVSAGADVLVAGSYVFGGDDPNQRVRTLLSI
jgi:ribulose-phosphate 3-epimerase